MCFDSRVCEDTLEIGFEAVSQDVLAMYGILIGIIGTEPDSLRNEMRRSLGCLDYRAMGRGWLTRNWTEACSGVGKIFETTSNAWSVL